MPISMANSVSLNSVFDVVFEVGIGDGSAPSNLPSQTISFCPEATILCPFKSINSLHIVFQPLFLFDMFQHFYTNLSNKFQFDFVPIIFQLNCVGLPNTETFVKQTLDIKSSHVSLCGYWHISIVPIHNATLKCANVGQLFFKTRLLGVIDANLAHHVHGTSPCTFPPAATPNNFGVISPPQLFYSNSI